MRRLCFLCVLLHCLPIAAAGEYDTAFQWFDGLHYPDTDGKPLVRVATGRWYQVGQKPRANRYLAGFLLKNSDNEFTVFTTDLNTQTFTPTPDGTPVHEVVGYESIDLQSFASEQIRRVKAGDQPRHLGGFRHKVGPGVHLFVLARGCDLAGHKTLANSLCNAAKGLYRKKTRGRVDLLGHLKQEIGLATMWQNIEDFGNKEFTREELLKRFENFSKRFPDSSYKERAEQTVAILREMIAEDKSRPANPKPFDDLPLPGQISDMIFRLRDQNGHQWSQPGACDIFNDEAGDASAASQLLKLGFEAVPALIEVLDDRSFTRSVGYHRDFYFSHHVLRVGDCAETIISRIAGRSFYVRKHTNGAMLKDGQETTSKQLIVEWWEAVKKKGYEQVLIDGVAIGDRNSGSQARMLSEKYPQKAFAAIQKGIANSSEEWVRADLMQQMGKLKNEDVEKYLTVQMHKAPDLESRVAAATQLHKSGNDRAVPAMMDEFRTVLQQSEQPNIGRLVYFLGRSNSPAAIDLVGAEFLNLSSHHRYEMISHLADRLYRDKKTLGTTLNHIEAFLIHALDDQTQRTGLSGSRFGQSFTDPRICDFAALVLAEYFDAYTFDISADKASRDRRLGELKQMYEHVRSNEGSADDE